MNQLKKVLLFGAGKSASALIDYLILSAEENNWDVIVADANAALIKEKTNNRPHSTSVPLDINDASKRRLLIESSDIVISMMPPSLHILIANDCLQFGKSLLTASYADEAILALDKNVKEKGLLFLCEMGLDPGIDHMSAIQLLDEIDEKGGKVVSFKSHCGGLVAPESDNNPWHYKISWNPRNVVLAGKSGAIYKKDGNIVQEEYEQLFDSKRSVTFENENLTSFSYYPNRNSLPYIDLYRLHHVQTFIRTTLRHPDFMSGWNNLVQLKMTDESMTYSSDAKTLADFYNEYLNTYNFDKNENYLFKQQLEYLGLHDTITKINKGICSPADVLQLALEKKLVLSKEDKDMIVMLHEIDYSINEIKHTIKSSLVVKGENHIHTAMAKTVGLPLGIAAKFILNGTIKQSGVQIPISKEIYLPVLAELRKYGVQFNEHRI
jgi:saccharopine dehydrogenase-like NADP-dependent oxidoreductase